MMKYLPSKEILSEDVLTWIVVGLLAYGLLNGIPFYILLAVLVGVFRAGLKTINRVSKE